MASEKSSKGSSDPAQSGCTSSTLCSFAVPAGLPDVLASAGVTRGSAPAGDSPWPRLRRLPKKGQWLNAVMIYDNVNKREMYRALRCGSSPPRFGFQ
jgi:hypothetical protein